MDINELKGIFEYELKRKLAQRSFSSIEELRRLISALKFYDFSNSMLLNKDQWIRGVLRTGLCGFNISDLAKVFDTYDPNKTGCINYLNFARYLYGKEEFSPIKGDNQLKNDEINNKGDIDKSKFVPPGLYERNIEENDIENNQNKSEQNLNKNEINNNNINDSMIPTKKNYHMTKSQSQIIPPNNNELLNQKEEPKEQNLNQNIPPNPQNNKNYFKNLLQMLRSKINTNNGITYYSLAHHLKSSEDKTTNTTNLETLLSTIKLLQLDINPDDIINFYACLDYTQSGKVSTDEILRVIVGEISERRKISIISKFGEMDKNKTGYLPILFLKKVYNAKFHPDCFLRKKPENEVLDEFMFTFEVFCYLKGLSADQEISYKDFVEYYTPISASIESDNYFDDILLGAWNIEDEKIAQNINNEINMTNNKVNNISKNININSNNNKILKTPNKRMEINKNNIKIEQRNSFQITQSPNRNITSPRVIPNQNFSPEKKLGKIRYNPITNEFTMDSNNQRINRNYNPNNNYIENKSNMNINSMNISDIPSINKLKTLLSMRGMKSIFIIQRMLYIYDKNQSGEIPFDKLCDIFEIYNINITKEEIFEFFEIIDKEHKGFIKYNDLILILINDINTNRRILIQYLFDKLRKRKEFVVLNDIKKYFNPDSHPDVIEKIKGRDEIAFDFFDSLEVFREYNINLKNENIINGIMSYKDFENYFKEISLSINDDKLFEYIIKYCWEFDNDYNNYGNKNGYRDDNVRIRAGEQIINNQNK